MTTLAFDPAPPALSPLELRVVRLAAARGERAGGSLVAARLDRVLGLRPAATLADPRLEALRSQAVAIRDGAIELQPGFVAAGFGAAHVARIAEIVAATARRSTPRARRDRLAYASGIGLALGSFAGFLGLTATLLAYN